MLKVLWGKKINQSSIQNAQVTSAVGEEGRLTFRNAVAVLAVFFCLHSNNSFAATDDTLPFNIPQQRADLALTLFAEQANLTLVFPFDQVKDKTANRLVGHYPVETAVTILLQGTGLTPTFSNQLVLNIAIESKGKRMNITNSSKRKTLLATFVAMFAAEATTQGAMAQTESATEQSRIDEIIVTATRRAESLNDTALSIAAIGNEEISRKNLTEMNDYLRTIPGVTFVDQGIGRNAVVVRGLSTDPEQSTAFEGNTVAVYFGEVPLTGLSSIGGTADLKMVDLERVEVLRGPQGTLFGSGALAGAVRNIPAAPDLQALQGKINMGYSNTAKAGGDNTRFEGVVNIPLIEDVLAIRAVAYRHDTSGYVKNIGGTLLATGSSAGAYSVPDAVAAWGGANLYQDKDIGDATYTGGRIAALWKPIDNLSVTLQYAIQDAEQEGFPYVQLNTGGYTQVSVLHGDVVPGSAGEELKDETSLTNLVLEYDFGWATLLSSSAWVEEDAEWDRGITSFLGGIPLGSTFVTSTEAIFEELRLVSSLDGPWQYTLGLYYEDIDTAIVDQAYGLTQATVDLFNTFGFGSTNPIEVANVDKSLRQLAFFGELSYDITEQFELTVGARRFDYEKSTFETRDNGDGAAGLIIVDSPKFDETGTVFRVNLSYDFNEDALVYGQFSEGFRLGNTNIDVGSTCDVNNDGILDGTNIPITSGFDSNGVENFELGAKLALLDNRLQINAAAYRIDWSDLPVTVTGSSPPSQVVPCVGSVTTNAGEARSQGFEIESTYQLNENIRINLGGAYTNAEYILDEPSLSISSGDRLPSSPEYNVNFGLMYDFELGGHASYVQGGYAYVGKFYSGPGETGGKGGDYEQLNMSAGITVNKFNVELFAHNLTDSDALTSVSTLFPDTRAYRLRPRTIGLNLSYQF